MRYALTNCGHRLAIRLQSAQTDALGPELAAVVLPLQTSKPTLESGVAASPQILDWLEGRGLVAPVPLERSDQEVRLGYLRNPLRHVQRFVFEYTTECGFSCMHCRNVGVERHTETRPERLCHLVDTVVPLGIGRFDFIGGEVTRYGRRWLEVAAHVRRFSGTQVVVLTSGWFLEQHDFEAAHGRCADDRALLADLRAGGVTHVVFSLDGPEQLHDRWRRHPGLYARVLRGFEKVREAGMTPQVSVVLAPGTSRGKQEQWLADLGGRLYESQPGPAAADRLIRDDFNFASNLIGVGGARKLEEPAVPMDAIPDRNLYCRNYFRPYPRIGVRATGEISLCPLGDAGDGYGSIHERTPLELLNHLQDAFVYKLHAERRVALYRRFVDRSLFGEDVIHGCTLRAILTMIARRMDAAGLDPSCDEGEPGVASKLRETNEQVAKGLGFG